MSLCFLPRWDDYLPCGGGHLVAVTGAPARRDLLAVLAGRAAAAGPVAVAGGRPLPGWPELTGGTTDSLPPRVHLAPPAETSGWGWLDALAAARPDRHYLADLGPEPAGLVNTLPAAADRPAATGLLLAVVDAAAPGRPPRDVVVPGDAAAAAVARRCDPLAGWSWDDTAAVLAAGRDAAALPPWAVVVLGLDHSSDSIGLFGFLGRCVEELGVPVVTVGTIGPDGPDLRTAVEAEGEAP